MAGNRLRAGRFWPGERLLAMEHVIPQQRSSTRRHKTE
jgi:hypothetical protein